MPTEAEGARELTQHGVLPSLAGGECGSAGVICTVMDGLYTACPDRIVLPAWQWLLSCGLWHFQLRNQTHRPGHPSSRPMPSSMARPLLTPAGLGKLQEVLNLHTKPV